MDEFCGSTFWDLDLTWNTTNPDFTECFQKTVLNWVPNGALWLLTPLAISSLREKKHGQKVPWTALNILKLVLSFLLTTISVLDLANVIMKYSDETSTVYPADVLAPCFQIASYLLTFFLILADKYNAVHQNSALFLFWFLSSIAGAVTYRSQLIKVLDSVNYQNEFAFISKVIAFPIVVAQLVLASFTDSIILSKNQSKNKNPVNYASFPSQALFGWFDKLAWMGYKNPLKEENLWDLDEEYLSDEVLRQYHEIQAEYQKKLQEETGITPTAKDKVSVGRCAWRMHRVEFLKSMVLRLMADVFTFVSPLMLQELIGFVSDKNAPAWHGYFFTVITFAGSLSATMCMHNYFFRIQSIGISSRALAIGSVYRKALKMSNSARRGATAGEIVNLMSVDSQRVMDVWPYFGYAATTPIIVAASLYMLWQLLGPSVLVGVAIIVIMVPLNLYLAGLISKLQAKTMKLKDQRTKLMNEVLSGMKVLKLYAWETSFYEQVDRIRQKELQILKKTLYIQSLTVFLLQFSPFLIAIGTFATYVLVDDKNVLDATKAFVSLTLFDLIRYPLNFVPMVINFVVQANVSLGRLNRFLEKDDLDENQITPPPKSNSIALEDEDVIKVDNGTFAWGAEDAPSLNSINLSIKKGSLVAVVGSVGSGKSSLVAALLGEMEKRTGTINRQGSVAYVSQQAWIQNATLKNNIIFGKSFSASKYKNIVEACALKADLEMLPGGDSTEIGEKGINLSGGQKQRVSLARAVYYDADIYFLDDPLSAVDSHVGKHLFEKVIGPQGVLKRKTRVLVTHGISYLPYVDSIVVLTNGSISEVGSYKELLEKGGAFSEFIMTYLKQAEELDELEEEELLHVQEEILSNIQNPDVKRKLSLRISKVLSSEEESNLSGGTEEELGRSIRRRRRPSRSISRTISRRISTESGREEKLEKINKAATLTQTEHLETGSVAWKVYSYYFKSSGWSLVICSFFILALSWTASVGSNIWLSEWSKDTPLPDGSQDSAQRDLRLGVYGGLGFGQAFFALIASLVLLIASLNAASLLHNDMLFNVLRSPMSFFDTTPLGRIMNRFSRDVDVIDTTIPTFLRPMFDGLLQIIGIVIVICLQTPLFAAVLLPISLIYYGIQYFFINTSRQMKRLESVSRSPIFSHFSETINGLSTIRAYGLQEDFIKQSQEKVDLNHKIFYPFLVAKRWLGVRLEIVGGLVVLIAALLAVINKESMDPGSVGLSISYAMSVTMVLNFLVRNWTELESNSVSIERMKEYGETETEAPWEMPEFRPLSQWPGNGVVEFKDYSTRYRKGLDLVLRGISCEIKKGEKIGIVGRTGAGKSSLTLALFRLIESAGGSIYVDGVDISKIGLHDLRSRLTIIPQDPVLFVGTLRMNLDPFNKYKDDQIWRALEHSHLKEFVQSLQSGLEHEVSEGGENLSVGQRQLVCLARALLRKTKVLILDEATAAVDLETDDLIQATIRKEFLDCTVLTIAHRLNTIMDSTRVMVLQNGVIHEFDTPSSLLQNNKSVFYSMAKDAGLV